MNEDSLEQPHANPSVPNYTASTETPRVDAEVTRQENWANEVHATTYACWMVMSDFARRLEKELNAALKWKEEDPRMLREQIRVADVAFNNLQSQLAAAREENAALRKEIRDANTEGKWQERQGEDYGTF